MRVDAPVRALQPRSWKSMAYLLVAASLVGNIAFAFSGVLVGVRHRLDWMGVFIVAFLAANGGGIVRDLLLGTSPAVLRSNAPLFVVGGVMTLSIIFKLHQYPDVERRGWFVLSDAVGLVAFAVTGSLAGIEADLPLFGVVALSLITAVGGGLLRDTLVGTTPLILHEGFYGSVAILLGVALYALAWLGWLTPAMAVLVCLGAFALRLAAHKGGWSLPKL
jgi:uncharacterized membrane protein YeiH